jgi:flavin reductase (DIM6/NTAB) family NADH-FMN oxidoreductase RutF
MRILPADQSPAENYLLMLGVIAPRPIAWVSTVGETGNYNLAPFSFFNGVSADPPILSLSIARRDGEKKDTLRNIEFTGDFVVNVVTRPLADAMNRSSASFPPEISEFEIAGLTPLPSEKVKAPRLGESPVQMECRLERLIEVGAPPRGSTLVLGEIVLFHLDERCLTDRKIDFKKFFPLGRGGRDRMTEIKEWFVLKRPR